MLQTTVDDRSKIWKLLGNVFDPEIPVLTIIDLGIVREINMLETSLEIVITPTYSGCPAMHVIENDIRDVLMNAGFNAVTIRTVITPTWTTDWISDEAKEKLRIYGIAPPEVSSPDKNSLTGKNKSIACPRCKSKNVEMISQFGSTACKALYRCKECKEPFDYFKCI